MRKTCVRGAKPVLAALIAIVAVSLQWSAGVLSAQSPDPLTLPRLAFADFYYLGGFRLPNTVAGDHFGLGGTVMAFNPAHNSLSSRYKGNVAGCHSGPPSAPATQTRCPSLLIVFLFDPTETFHELATSDAALAGLVVHGNRLWHRLGPLRRHQ
jgi:hypothetical protein